MRIPESDWKVFKKLRAEALARFSEQILGQCRSICNKESVTAHERYRELYQLLQDRDDEMSRLFDDFRRSTAIPQLKMIWQSGLLQTEELQELSAETWRAVEAQ